MSDDLVEGRVRRARPLLVAAAALAVLAGLPFVVRSSPTEAVDPVPAGPTAQPAATPLEGRLVYTTFESTGLFDRRHRLWGLDLETGELTEGPLVVPVEELSVIDPDRGVLLLVTAEGGTGVAYLVDGLSRDAELREVARGDILTLTTDRSGMLVGRVHRRVRACGGRGYELSLVSLAEGLVTPLGTRCGRLLGLASFEGDILVSEVRGRRPVVRSLGSNEVVVRGFALVSAAPNGDLLLADPERESVRALGVWPETPTGALFVWRGGSPQPLLPGRRLFGERLVSWSADGGAAVVSGIVGGDRGMYLVRDGVGAALLPPNSFPLRSAYSGASFDAAGAAFAATVGRIVVTSATGVEPVLLPPEAPTPLGPVVWLP